MLVRLILAGLLLALPAAAQEVGDGISGAAEVVDGDGIRIADTSIRLYGINAIEMRNPMGEESREALANVIGGRRVDCLVIDIHKGRWGNRPVAQCMVGPQIDIAAEMIRRGWASPVQSAKIVMINPDLIQEYDRLHIRARWECRGLWSALDRCQGR